MNNYRWVPIIAAVVLAAMVGVMAYNAGVAHGIQQSGKIVMPPPGAYPYPMYGWHPWGFGFFFAPLFFLFFFFFIVRGLFWRGRHGYGYGCGHHWQRPPQETTQQQ